MFAIFQMLGGWEWVIILVVILLLFGHRLPGMARSLGSGITEFKRGLKEGAEKGSSGGDKLPPSSDAGAAGRGADQS